MIGYNLQINRDQRWNERHPRKEHDKETSFKLHLWLFKMRKMTPDPSTSKGTYEAQMK